MFFFFFNSTYLEPIEKPGLQPTDGSYFFGIQIRSNHSLVTAGHMGESNIRKMSIG